VTRATKYWTWHNSQGDNSRIRSGIIREERIDYLLWAWGLPGPEEWGAELEAQMPVHLRDWSHPVEARAFPPQWDPAIYREFDPQPD
jgi:hypothetical protein